MANITVSVTDANNITVQLTPVASQTITIDRGVAGNGISSIVPVTISTLQYLRIFYTNGTQQDVGPLTSTAYAGTSPIDITGNTISLTTVPINLGGTNATTAAAAIQNLLPSYTGNGSKRLGLNSGATGLEWVADGGGTVTSVAVDGGTTGLTTSGGPITGSGTITLAGTLAIANGGTNGTATPTAGAVPYGTGTAYAFTAAGTAGQVLQSNGASAPTWVTPASTGVTSFSAGTTGFTPSTATSGAVSLSGTLATTNGGTGLTSFTNGGIVYASSTSALATGSALTFSGTTLGLSSADSRFTLTSTGSGQTVGISIKGGAGGGDTFNFIESLNNDNTQAWYLGSNGTSNVLAFKVAGSEAMRLTSTSLYTASTINVGIGTSSIDERLCVVNTGTYAAVRVSNGTNSSYFGYANADTNYNAFAKAGDAIIRGFNGVSIAGGGGAGGMRLDSSGNLGIGTTTPVYKLDVRGTISSGLNYGGVLAIYDTLTSSRVGYVSTDAQTTGNNDTNLAIVADQVGKGIKFFTNNSATVKAYLDSSGNLLVGAGITSSINGTFCPIQGQNNTANQVAYFRNTNANPYGTIVNYSAASPNNTGNEFVYCTDSTTNRFGVRSNGGVANYSANDVNLSDRREKTNFAPAKSYLDVICAIPVQTFNYIDQNLEEDAGLTLGVVAQDVQAVAPEMVMESNWGTKEEPKMRLSIYQTDLQYALMKCIQEQQAIITQLTARITALEAT